MLGIARRAGCSSGRVWKARLELSAAVPPGSQDPLKGLGGGTHMCVAFTMTTGLFTSCDASNYCKPYGRDSEFEDDFVQYIVQPWRWSVVFFHGKPLPAS